MQALASLSAYLGAFRANPTLCGNPGALGCSGMMHDVQPRVNLRACNFRVSQLDGINLKVEPIMARQGGTTILKWVLCVRLLANDMLSEQHRKSR